MGIAHDRLRPRVETVGCGICAAGAAFDDRCAKRGGFDVAERFANGKATREELIEARVAAEAAYAAELAAANAAANAAYAARAAAMLRGLL